MTKTQPEKFPLTSMDVAGEKRVELKHRLGAAFPEAFSETTIDFDQLKRVLGEWVEPSKERFGLNWPGKAECIKIIQQSSLATLKPSRSESVNFDDTKNVFIEGDNLEVLKLLQKSYFGKVKLIYIDPPYNTGKQFIYPDKYSETLETYLAYTGQIDDKGKKFSTNIETSGRFHSRWLNMMYPRLYLARNLLKETGAIFISIDDNEYHNLRSLCDEVFGSENHVATLQIKVRYEGKTLVEDMDFQKLTEQVLIYSKSDQLLLNKKSEKYSFEKFKYRVVEKGSPRAMELGGKKVEIFDDGKYEINEQEPGKGHLKEIWATGKILDGNSSGRFFRDYLSGRFSEDGLGVLYKVYGVGEERTGYRYFTGPKKEGATRGKYYQSVPEKVLTGEKSEKTTPIVTYYDFADSFGNCRHEGAVDFRDGKKPLRFLMTLVDMIKTGPDDMFLDFFAGSCSFAHATIEYNRTHGGQRTCVSVQLPERISAESDLVGNGFKTVAEIGRTRLRNVAAANSEGTQSDLGLETDSSDVGFKAFCLSQSNFKVWDGNVQRIDDLGEELSVHVHHLVKDSTAEDILYEFLLKAGFPLTTTVEKRKMAGKEVFAVQDGALLICPLCQDSCRVC